MVTKRTSDMTSAANHNLNHIADVEQQEHKKLVPQRHTLHYILQTRPDDVPPSIAGALPKLDNARNSPAPATRTYDYRDATPTKMVEATVRGSTPRGVIGTLVLEYNDVRPNGDANPDGEPLKSPPRMGRADNTEEDDEDPLVRERKSSEQEINDEISRLDDHLMSPPRAFDSKHSRSLIEALLDAHSPSRNNRRRVSQSPPRRGVPGIAGQPIDEKALTYARTLQSSSPLLKSNSGGSGGRPTSPTLLSRPPPVPPTTSADDSQLQSQQQQQQLIGGVSINKPKSYAIVPAGTKVKTLSTNPPRSISAHTQSRRLGTPTSNKTATAVIPGADRSTSRLRARGTDK